MRRPRWPISGSVVTGALAIVLAQAAWGQGVEVPPSNGGVLGIAPSRQDAIAVPPVSLEPTKVFNSTQTTYRVRMFVTRLIQGRDGALDASPYARDRARAAKMVSLVPDTFRIGPRENRIVVSEWRRLLPKRAKAGFVALVMEAVPELDPAQGAAIAPTARIVAARLLLLPGPYRARGRILRLVAEQAEPRVLRFVTRIRNTGRAQGGPTNASLTIVDSNGRQVFRRSLPDGDVLPRFVRDYVVTLEKRLPPGAYRATSRLTLGRSHLRRSTRFRLTAPNVLPTRRLEITALDAEGEEKGPAEATVSVENTGSAESPIVITAKLFRIVRGLPDGKPVAVETIERDGSEPGAVERIDFEIGELGEGTYRVLAAVSDGERRYNKFTADFVADQHRTVVTRAKDFVEDNVALFGVFAAFAIAMAALFWSRARVRRAEAASRADAVAAVPAGGPDPAPPVESAPPNEPEPAPAGDLININTASADELLMLPGVGRKAAERIVAYRDEHGAFASLDDLGNVEGFDDPARIRRLAPHATV